ncbi:DUF21-domain-containing protein [Atractiella rhizophila]|nr:DUF21-domain-containing protein [Atractiella rhizophila]
MVQALRATCNDEPPLTLQLPPAQRHQPHLRHHRKAFRINPAIGSLFGIVIVLLGLLPAATHAKPTATEYSYLEYFPTLSRRAEPVASTCACKDGGEKHDGTFIAEAIMIPVLVLLSGVFAGLTLGYMSLDPTQLKVLMKTGTPTQMAQAKKIAPIVADKHLLLTTLLLANMIVNETLPVVADPVLGGGIQAVVASTALIVIFSEIIPQSVCTRFGLQIGAKCAFLVRFLIYLFYIIAWPVAKLLHFVLGPHSGIVYRRAELKELIALHEETANGAGDLNKDTVTIVGGALDLQGKSVKDAMTPIDKVFMLNINSKLDFETLGAVLKSGHSRVPVYEETVNEDTKTVKKTIKGVLLVKNLVLLDPEDALPLSQVPISPLPVCSDSVPLLSIINVFQDKRSHMAICYPTARLMSPQSTETDMTVLDDEKRSKRRRGSSASPDKEKSLLKSIFKRRYDDHLDDEEKAAEIGLRKTDSEVWRPSLIDEPCGIITLEDVLEELIGEEIYDETDIDPTGQPAPMQMFIPPEAAVHLAPGIAKEQKKSRSSPLSNPFKLSKGSSESKVKFGDQTPPAGAPATGGKDTPTKSMSADDAGTTGGGGFLQYPLKIARSLSQPRHTPPSADKADKQVVDDNLAFVSEGKDDDGSATEPDLDATIEKEDVEPRRKSMDDAISSERARGRSTSPAIVSPTPQPLHPLLSDAVLLERGRRRLAHQGVDPNAVNLRIAPRTSPSSSAPGSPSVSRTPSKLLVIPPSATASKGKKTFKTPPTQPLPLRTGARPPGLPSGDVGEEGEKSPEVGKDESDNM